jgi:regulator of protease activity HflC (stomatin/prohibitin superfamily)
MPAELLQLAVVVIVLAVVLISQSIRIIYEWERGVVFRLGALQPHPPAGHPVHHPRH